MNSLHNQGVNKLAPGVRVEGTAPDGTIEAVHVIATAAGPVPGFAVGVQWHPENDWRTDIVSRRIFDDFAAAVHAYAEDGAHRRGFGRGGLTGRERQPLRALQLAPCHSRLIPPM